MYVMTRRLGFLSGEFLAKTQPGVVDFIQALNSIPLPIAPGYAKYPGHTPIWNAAMDMGKRWGGRRSNTSTNPKNALLIGRVILRSKWMAGCGFS